MSVLEAVWVKSAAYATNAAEIDTKVFSKFGQVDGVIARYKGTNVAKPDEHVWVIIWENKAKLDAFKNGGSESITGPFRSLLDAPPTFTSIPIDSTDYQKVLAAPVVSFGYATPKDGVTSETVAPFINKLIATQQTFPASHGFIRGPVHEKANTFLSVMGWDSVEAHHETRQSDKIAPVLAELRGHISDLDLRDVKLSPFTM